MLKHRQKIEYKLGHCLVTALFFLHEQHKQSNKIVVRKEGFIKNI